MREQVSLFAIISFILGPIWLAADKLYLACSGVNKVAIVIITR